MADRKNKRKKKSKFRETRIELLIIFLACLVRLGWEYHLTQNHQRQQEALRAAVEAGARAGEADGLNGGADEKDGADQGGKMNEDGGAGQADAESSAVGNEPDVPVILEKYAELYAENADMVGWLSIPETRIDYPVMQRAGDEYYLYHDFYGQEDKHGCLFVKEIADVDTPGDCFIIYGHNMRDKTMFGDLDEYRSEAYYNEHPLLIFDSLYEEREYEIMAVFLSHVYKEGEEGFRYYEFYTADTEEEFEDFYENVKEKSLYDTGVRAVYGDTFLMLSTCAYHEEDGRLVVVAKRKAD